MHKMYKIYKIDTGNNLQCLNSNIH